MRKVQFAVIVAAFLSGCAIGGVQDLGTAQLLDGRQIQVIQARTKGEGPEIVTADTYICYVSEFGATPSCELSHRDVASGESVGAAVATTMSGAVPAAAGALSLGLPAHLLRPDSTRVEQVGGGSTSTSESQATGGSATSSATQTQASQASSRSSARALAKQRQGQRQSQSQQQTQSQSAPAPAHHHPAPMPAPMPMGSAD